MLIPIMLIPNKITVTYDATSPDGKKYSEKTESNAVNTEILTYSVSKEIRSDKTAVRAGETVRYTATLTNDSAAELFDIFFRVPQPENASFVTGSVKINKTAQPSCNPITGFYIPDINTGETVVIEYAIKAEKPTATPATQFATFDYTVNDPVRGNAEYSENTDKILLNVMEKINDTFQIVIRRTEYFATGNYIYPCRNCCDCSDFCNRCGCYDCCDCCCCDCFRDY